METTQREASHAPNPFDLSTLTGSMRYLSAEEHGIKDLGAIGLCRFGSQVRIVMTHPDGVDVRDLLSWDTGNRIADAGTEAEAVLSGYLGADANSGGAPDSVEIAHGRIIYTQHQAVGDAAIDPEDLAAWAGDFIAIGDPAVQRGLIIQIVERYERN